MLGQPPNGRLPRPRECSSLPHGSRLTLLGDHTAGAGSRRDVATRRFAVRLSAVSATFTIVDSRRRLAAQHELRESGTGPGGPRGRPKREPSIAKWARLHGAVARRAGGILGLCLLGCAGPRTAPALLEPDPPHLLRALFLVGGAPQSIDLDLPLPFAEAHAPFEEAVRQYEILLPGERSTRLIEDGPGAGGALVVAARRVAIEALRAAQRSPRQKLEWHVRAFAGFFATSPELLEPAEVEEILAALAGAPTDVVLARSLFESAARLPPETLKRLSSSDVAAERLLALVPAAREGNPAALGEILRLSLEHHSALLVFDAAIRLLFPRRLAPELHARFPASGGGEAAGGFLAAVQAGLSRCRHVPSGAPGGPGWRLDGQPGEPGRKTP